MRHERKPEFALPTLGSQSAYAFREGESVLADIEVFAPSNRPWRIELWEPLRTKAPCPDKTQPYCCYINTVIFYVRPYIVRPWHHFWISRGKRRAEKPGSELEKWDQIKTRLAWDDVIEWNGMPFRCGGGSVEWQRGRWWMHMRARRERKPHNDNSPRASWRS